ncbi:MAG: transporter substrate-binding domain-containing protein [Rhodoferax sp.]|nr:transporter substrate-binding domain-containing protein [Rhodoferax sp.]
MRNHTLSLRWGHGLLLAILSLGMAAAQARDMAEIKASGRLIVAIPDQRNPPFFFEDQGELKGLDIDLAKSVAEALGVQAVFNRDGKSFNDAVKLVAEDRADMSAAKISRTLARSQTVLFSNPYITLPHAMLVNRLRFAQIAKGKSMAEVMQDYSDTIGVIANSSFVGYAKTYFPKAKVVEFATWDQVVDAVAKGEVSTAYRDAFEVKRIIKVKPDLVLTVRSVMIEDIKDTIGIAVNSKNYLLLNFLNLFLEQKNIRFTSEQILSKYEKFLN